jgi:glucosylceramidase
MSAFTRRDALKLGAVGGALGQTALASKKPKASDTNAPHGSIDVRLTAGSKRFSQEPALRWVAASGGADGAILLDPSKTYQEILGFGAAFTDAACYMINQLDPAVREHLFHELFDPAEMGLSVCRTCVGSSDYSVVAFSYDDGDPDPELMRFSIDFDRQYILPTLRLARKINPDLHLFASPWSPPGWMKDNGSMLGGSMRKHYLGVYAKYIVKFLQAYAAEGATINSLSPQNEVDTDQDGRMPACLWAQENEIEFVAKHLGPELANSSSATKIWILDHNYNLWGRVICELEDPDLYKYVDGVAWHGYAGVATEMTRVHDVFPEKHTYWTEGGPILNPNYETDWNKWATKNAEILSNWSRCVISWNLALDEKGHPNIGPAPCAGFVTIDAQTKEIMRSGQYWTFAHYARAGRRGARRFDSRTSLENISHVAFANPDGSNAVVIGNPGTERQIRMLTTGKMVQLTLPADSLMTLSWR